MLQNAIRLPNILFAFIVALTLSACTTQLAPAYDDALLQGLVKADEKALVLFSAVSNGSGKQEFREFSSRYDNLIGTFGSLQNQAKARATPPLAKKLAEQMAKYEILKDVCGGDTGDPGSCVNSSPSAMAEIINTLSKMRETHESQGLKKDIVKLFKGSYDISINQAITVETALKRTQ